MLIDVLPEWWYHNGHIPKFMNLWKVRLVDKFVYYGIHPLMFILPFSQFWRYFYDTYISEKGQEFLSISFQWSTSQHVRKIYLPSAYGYVCLCMNKSHEILQYADWFQTQRMCAFAWDVVLMLLIHLKVRCQTTSYQTQNIWLFRANWNEKLAEIFETCSISDSTIQQLIN